MKAKVISFTKSSQSDVELKDSVFGLPLRKDVLQRVVEWQRAKKHAGTHSTQERGDVTGTTAKPFRQKGTGNARQGSKKAPHMRGGAIAHGPEVRSHAYKLSKKFRALGLKTALSHKLSEGKLFLIDSAKLKSNKTKDLSTQLNKLKLSSVLFIDTPQVDENLKKAASNLKGTDVLPEVGANVYDILKHDNVILSVDAAKKLEERLA